ncbi:MAG: HAMP domain-containing protein [Oligoflexia bacterium]|nr:HAMP domain-containing protein [Oligoflexia bacterium]
MRPHQPDPTPTVQARFPGSLRARLFGLLVAFSLGPLLFTNAWGYIQTRLQLTRTAFQNAQNVAALEASDTLGFVHSRRELLSSIAAGNRYLSSLVLAMATTQDPVQEADYLDRLHMHLAAKAAETESTEALIVLDKNFKFLATSEDSLMQTVAETTKICRWSSGDNTITVGPDLDPVTGTLSQPAFVHAVVLRAQDKPIGFLCGRFQMDIRKELLRAHRERTTDADVYLVDSAGRLLFSSSDDPSQRFGALMHPAALAIIQAGEQWVGRYDSPIAGEAIGAYAPMPSLGWGIMLELPDRKALAAVERLKWQAIVLGTAFVALMFPVMFVTARTTARPLHTLADAARRMESGVVGERVPEVGAVEMRQLARSFNSMSTALKEAHDLLEGRIAERTAALQRSQEFTELLLNSIEQRVLVVDSDLRILKANHAAVRLHGQPLVGERRQGLLIGDTAPCEGCPVCQVFATGRPTRDEITIDTVRGKDILQIENFPVLVKTDDPAPQDPAAQDRVEAVVQIGRVVTVEKQLVAQAMHQEKMAALGLLAAGLAHEIGNPLASIQSQLRLVREMPDSERAQQTLPVIEKQVQRMAGLLRELTNFARRKRDDVVLVSVAQVIGDVARLLGHDPRSRCVNIVTDGPPTLPGVRAREDQLVQVLLNLGINAMDAMPEGGTLRIEGQATSTEVIVRVIDTGTGIAEEMRARLFEPLLSTKASGRGTGLGLFVSRGIVEGLKGSLVMERTGDDGTVFAVHIPLEAGT